MLYRTLVGALGMGLVSTSASADTWKSRLVLVPEKSIARNCGGDVSRIIYDFNFDGRILAGGATGRAPFSAAAAPDGGVKTTFEISNGPFELTGNARTRELEIFSTKHSCRYKLVPI